MGEASNLSGIQAALNAAALPPIQIITRVLADSVFSRFYLCRAAQKKFYQKSVPTSCADDVDSIAASKDASSCLV